MDRDTETELVALRGEVEALRRAQAWPQAITLVALLLAVMALLAPVRCW